MTVTVMRGERERMGLGIGDAEEAITAAPEIYGRDDEEGDDKEEGEGDVDAEDAGLSDPERLRLERILEKLSLRHFPGLEDIVKSVTDAKAQPRSVAKITY
jgi:hypothetical protein